MLRYTYKNIHIYLWQQKQAGYWSSVDGRSKLGKCAPSRAVLLNLMRTVEKIEKNI